MMLRERLHLEGIVQGVGFRPFVHRLAHELALSGWVRNDAHGITIEAEGPADALASLRQRLASEAPVNARIARIEHQPIVPAPADAERKFRIIESSGDAANTTASIAPDTCTCPACLAELFDPANRRHRYAFINCTDCGPRYTIARALPWDRARTSMADFALCPRCAAEYADPASRRFHAEPNACPHCGPRLQLVDVSGHPLPGDPIQETVQRLHRGEILAIKGLGGFHLVCDARNAGAVARLRVRKQRDEQPFAVMFANTASITPFAHVDEGAREALEGSARPIVLLRKLKSADRKLAGVAPGVGTLGAMLPCTPLHYLLFHAAAGNPPGTRWMTRSHDLVLVMTSANLHGEPLITDNAAARRDLADIADAWLMHDREIVTRCDDSVVRHSPDHKATQFIRRARGFTPQGIALDRSGADVLALGAHFKNTLCFTRAGQAFLSPHIGDLDRVANCRALETMVAQLQDFLHVRPQAIAHDLHPDFFSTRLALQLAERWQLPGFAIQHHHAHIAAVLAEHRIDEPVLGLALDGVGLGDDSTAWGGELLRVEGAYFKRLGRLRPIALPGGDRAAREPWRMGAAALALLDRSDQIQQYFPTFPAASNLARLLASHTLSHTSSMGRWFDAAAGLLRICPRMSFEGQAAMLLEGLAERHGPVEADTRRYLIQPQRGISTLDLAPLLEAMLDDAKSVSQRAALFHATLVEALADWVEQQAIDTGIRLVACAGGCFHNALLAQGLRRALTHRGLIMLEAQATTPGDGGIALGQAWITQRLMNDPARETS